MINLDDSVGYSSFAGAKLGWGHDDVDPTQ